MQTLSTFSPLSQQQPAVNRPVAQGFQATTLSGLQFVQVSPLVADQVHFAGKTPAARNLMALTPAQIAFEKQVVEMLKPYDVHQIQEWDELKQPPLPILRAFVESGTFVNGVPLPAITEAAPMVNDPTVRQMMGEAKTAEMAALLAHPEKLQAGADKLKAMGVEGLNKYMCLASVTLPKMTSVGVSTFLGVNTGLAAQSISKIGTKAQQAFWLNALNNGIFTYGFGLTEEAVGSDPRSIKTTFKKEIDPKTGKTVYRLNGNKKFIGNAAQVKDAQGNILHRGADFLAVYAVDDSAKAPADRSFRCFMVPRTLIGEQNIRHTGNEHNKLGLREVNNGDFDLKDVMVPEELMLGVPDECVYKKMLGLLDITRMFVGAMSLGSAEGSIEIAKKYMAEREQNGGKIQEFQAVAFPIAKLEAKAAAAKLLLMEATNMVDQAEADKVAYFNALPAIFATLDAVAAPLAKAAAEPPAGQKLLAEVVQANKALLGHIGDAKEALEKDVKPKAALEALQEAQKALKASCKGSKSIPKGDFERLEAAIGQVKKLKPAGRFGQETAMAKLYCSELAEQAAQDAIDTLGGRGFLEDPAQGLGLAKRRRDAKVVTIYEGTSKINRNIIGQGAFLTAAKMMNQNVALGVRYYLLKNGFTKRMRYKLLKTMARTPKDRVEAAMQYAMVDAMSKYNAALETIKTHWKANGVPKEYAAWDKKSIERQQYLLASKPVQARMQLIADMAVNRRLMHLSLEHLDYLKAKGSLTAEEKKRVLDLTLFIPLAEEAVVSAGRELGAESLKTLEARWQQKYANS